MWPSVSGWLYIYIYIYIYICIYRHLETDGHMISLLFRVVSLERCFKLWSKLSQTCYPTAIVIIKSTFYVYLSTYTLSVTWSAKYIRKAIWFQLMWQPANLPDYSAQPIGGNIYIYIYTVIHRRTVSVNHNSSVWLYIYIYIYCSVLLVHWALYQENFKCSCLNNFLSWWNYSQLRFNWTKNTIYTYICIYISHLLSMRVCMSNLYESAQIFCLPAYIYIYIYICTRSRLRL